MSDLNRRELLRRGIGATAAGGLLPLLAACGDSGSSGTKAEAVAKGTVTVWMHEEEAYHPFFQTVVAEYQKANPKVQVKPLFIPIAQLDTKLTTAFAGGKPPDILKIGAWTIPDRVNQNQLAELDPRPFGVASLDELGQRYDRNAFAPLTDKGKVFGVPIDYNSVHLFYRRDRFEEAGLDPDKPPTTWEQVADYSEKLTGDKKVGMQWVGQDPIWAMLQLLPLVRGLGGGILDDDASAGSLNTPEGIKAITYYAGQGNPRLSDPVNAFGLFAKGKAAMIVGGRFAVQLSETLDKSAKFGKNFDVAPIPAWQGGKQVASGYSWGWAVARQSKNPYTAWHFINYLQSKTHIETQLQKTGLVTPVKGWESLPSAKDEASQILARQIPFTDFGPSTPRWNEMSKALLDNLEAARNKRKSPEEAAEGFDNAMKDVL